MNDLSPIGDASALMRYDVACRALAEARNVDEVKDFRDKAEAMRAYARQAKNRQLETDAAEIRIRAERRIGELMAAQKEAGLINRGAQGTGSNQHEVRVSAQPAPPTLAEVGIDKNLADRARKLAAVPAAEFEGRVQQWRDEVREVSDRVTVNLLASGDRHVRGTFGTGENEWYTPADFIAKARAVLGSIDLDPASSSIANATVGAAQFFSESDNGLERDWAGNVWLNPPYAQPAIAHFADKMVAEWATGRVTAAIVLTHNYTDTAWFHVLARKASAICFTRGRVRFESPSGELAAPTQGQAFFYFGNEVDIFSDVFGQVGFVVEVHQ